MKRIKIDPRDYPKDPKESWWVVYPNDSRCEFRLPSGAVTVCTKDFLTDVFKINTAYNILHADNHNGWITVECNGDLYEMPQYLFVRHFDAEAFVVGVMSPIEAENAKPFDYKSTVPHKPSKDLESFKG